MQFHRFALEGPVEIVPRRIGDERGHFCETFRLDRFREEAGDFSFVQDNESLSRRPGTLKVQLPLTARSLRPVRWIGYGAGARNRPK